MAPIATVLAGDRNHAGMPDFWDNTVGTNVSTNDACPGGDGYREY